MKFRHLVNKALGIPNQEPAPRKPKRTVNFCLPKAKDAGLRPAFLRACLTQGKRQVFVETGTYMGETSKMASNLFEEVHTVELSKELFEAASRRFAGDEKITCHFGDSAKVLPTLLERFQGRTVFFWLDGHYSDGPTAKGDCNTPIVAELDAIRTSGLTDWVIAIDDLRIFRGDTQTNEPTLSGYPTARSIVEQIHQIDPHARIGIWGDAIVAFSSSNNCALDRVSGWLLDSRVFDESSPALEKRLKDAIDSEERIRTVNKQTTLLLKELARSYPNSERFGLGGHYHLWAGLASMGQKQWREASTFLRRALELDVRHWRVSCYLAESLLQSGLRLKAFEVTRPLERTGNQHPLLKATCDRVITESLDHILETTGERSAIAQIARLLPKQAIVFDVGAHVGDWSYEALRAFPAARIHAFEPIGDAAGLIARRFTTQLASGQLKLNGVAVGAETGAKTFNQYADAPAWSGFYPRQGAEIIAAAGTQNTFSVPVTSLDDYCSSNHIHRIHYLKVDVEGAELDVMIGAQSMLERGNVDALQFEYGGTFRDAGVTLREVAARLAQAGMKLFRITPGGLISCTEVETSTDTYAYENYIAIHNRLAGLILGEQRKLDWRPAWKTTDLVATGVIHVGAHIGSDYETYRDAAFHRMFFVEANPTVFKTLEANIGGKPGVKLACAAASDSNGVTTFRITSMDQSSSILKLKRHKDIYPDIKEVETSEVPCFRLDDLLLKHQEVAADYNLLNIDVQGAELYVLRGAENILAAVSAINLEVNLEELYEGCALLDQIDEFLEAHGFKRIWLDTPYHPLWGDAFYVKHGTTRRKDVVSMSSLGENGRFGNQFFQYAFLKTYGLAHNLNVENPPWIGQRIFQITDTPCSTTFAELREPDNDILNATWLRQSPPPSNVDFWGYFQFHTSYYRPYREYLRSLFRFNEDTLAKTEPLKARLLSQGKTIVGIHLRRGDYRPYEATLTDERAAVIYRAPSDWYKEWLRGFWHTLDSPVLFIASDEPEQCRLDFADYPTVISSDLGEGVDGEESFINDFYLLTQCHAVAISNSSFSFASCMLNTAATIFARPHLPSAKLVPFDPWNSNVLLRDQIISTSSETSPR